ncbi:MAG: thiamine pyrophosphate-dependent dehydrogenase E1 component subunit alpha [Eubacteriales bacterium]|nr:thiamine pyrophosphate-dependent dehydrogenase E1 component subunit alpha [Eubacteriales bacterium]
MIGKEKYLQMYSYMHRTRKFEEAVTRLFESNKLRGSVHIGIGQEACTAAGIAALRDSDWIIPSHRGHGQSICKGTGAAPVMAELMGKATGCCKGRGGTVHISDMKHRNLGVCAIIGGSMCNSVGVGIALKMDKSDSIILVFLGDGANNEGNFHESLNMAAIWKLPIVYLCENNGFAISVSFEKATAGGSIANRATSYGIPGICVDGNDVTEVYETVSEAIERARTGGGPTLIEAKTYRWKGHWLGDPEVYRSREDVQCWIERCPIKRLENKLIESGLATRDELDTIARSADKEIEDAIAFAEESPVEDTAQVEFGVFADRYEGSGWQWQ